MNYPRLSFQLLSEKLFQSNWNLSVNEKVFNLPEKILQFGTGSLIMGVADYFINKGTEKGTFEGRLVAVDCTSKAVSDKFKSQDNLFLQGVLDKDGNLIRDLTINCSISRVLELKQDWEQILRCAANPDLSIIILDVSEKKTWASDNNISEGPSIPFILAHCLFERFRKFKGDSTKGLVIITVNDSSDSTTLKDKIIELSRQNNWGEEFVLWIQENNRFCNSFIEGNASSPSEIGSGFEVTKELGFQDDLFLVTEPNKLWAIEGDNKIKEKLSFYKSDKAVVISKNIDEIKERKLRISDGAEIISAALGFLSGFNTIRECMEDSLMAEYIENVMLDEIVPAMEGDRHALEVYALEVRERFLNSPIETHLINTASQFTSKINDRNKKSVLSFYKKFIEVPRYFSLGFAAYILFMKAEKLENGKYYGIRDNDFYLIEDDFAEFFYEKWRLADLNTINSCRLFVEDIIDEEILWENELKMVTGFSDAVAHSLFELIHKGVKETLEEFVEFGEIEE